MAMAETSVPAASAFDDPQVMYRGWWRSPESAPDLQPGAEHFMVTQALPDPGKRSLRISVANSEVSEAKDDLAAVRLRVRVELRKSLYDLPEVQGELRIHDEHVPVAQQAIATCSSAILMGS